MYLLLVGLSHDVAGVETRGEAALDPDQVKRALTALQARQEVSGAFVLATCGRTELYLTGPHPAELSKAARSVLRELHPSGYRLYAGALRDRAGQEAARNLFRVASGLDSLLVGESEVLGQLREAIRTARRLDSLDPLLRGTVDRAVATARAARSASGIGRGAVSVGQAAVAYLRETGVDPRRTGVLVVGAGQVGELALKALCQAGAEPWITSRSGDTAAALAARHGGRPLPASALAGCLAEVGVVVCSSSSPAPLLTADLLRPVLASRREPLTILDLAVPKDVEPVVASLPGVSVAGLDDLARRVAASLRDRRLAAAEAERVVEERLLEWGNWSRMQEIGATLAALGRYADGIREAELRRALHGLGDLDPKLAARFEALSRSLVSKLLIHPISYLRSNPEDRVAAELMERIFSRPPDGR